MIESYKNTVFNNYATFTGRARRQEYWYFILMNVIIVFAFFVPMFAFSDMNAIVGPWTIVGLSGYAIAMILPTLALISRRLHDIGKSGWYYFVRFIPVIGPIWFLIMMCTAGDVGSNQYGNDPKQIKDEIDEIGITRY
ncbi:DUF805 domain-containing protein [Flavobacterium sp.]|uniref:DUF805 domain-containing protein n=1 Tax=Flavobacterium sp. TaxID=239 RepID=UPI0028BD52ED|nr:DUF805 domain-containing protein [Flavobacterium sp.]